MITDPIANLLTTIRNASDAGHPITATPASKQKERILKVLVEEGFIASYEAVENEDKKPVLKIRLQYAPNGRPLIRDVKRLSRPGRRLYVGKDEIPVFRGGLGLVLVSTSQGMLTDREARKRGVGGELVCSVF